MGLQTLVDRGLLKIIRNHGQSKFLRGRFRKQYGIEIGLYTIGAFDRWRLSAGTQIGRYCSIASSARVIDANHPVDAVSTHPFFYRKDWGIIAEDRVHAEPTVIEDDVWLGHQAIITPQCKRVGRGAVIGAGAVVMRDVPRFAVMIGAPAKLVRYRFPPDVIEAIEATRWWELDHHTLREAAQKVPEFLSRPTVEHAQAFLRALGRPEFVPKASAAEEAEAAGRLLDEATIVSLLQRDMPEFAAADLDRPFTDLPIDSFGLINLRVQLENLLRIQISDHRWGHVLTPRDLQMVVKEPAASVALPRPVKPPIAAPSDTEYSGATERRQYRLNMPQMALRGLSESWLFKEIGDLHWSNITRGLGASSSQIADDTGARLYATFTRFRFESDTALTGFRENDPLSLQMSATRFGAGIFFGDALLESPTGQLRAQVMSTFSKFGEHGANTSLLKGQPRIPEACPIPALNEMPPFGLQYRELKSRQCASPLFEADYVIQPQHDINGVGLLYFAAYPVIAELCAAKIGGSRISMAFSTVRRDISYFANCSPSETLIFRLLRWDENETGLSYEATLSRKSDDVTMAHIATEKQAISSGGASGSRSSPNCADHGT